MTIEEIHFNVKLRASRMDTHFNREFTPAEIDEILNSAQLKLVNRIFNGITLTREGMEDTQQVSDMLSTLVVSSPDLQPPLSPSFISNNTSIFKLSDTIYPYKQYLRSYVESEDCPNKIIDVNITPQDYLTVALKTVYKKPSLRWSRCIGTFSKEVDDRRIIIYTNGEFKASKLYLTYLKQPNLVTIGGYTDIQGNLKVKTECELPVDMHDRLVDEAVVLLQGIVENPSGFQISNSFKQ